MSDNSTAALGDLFEQDPRLRSLITVSDGHWLWDDRALDEDGYGVIWFDGYNWRAHRYVYALLHGLTDLPIDHVCRVRRCVNALVIGEHLEPVSTAENNYRIPTHPSNATHCSQGHEFTPENTITRAGGKRRCRRCHADQERDRRARRKAAG